MGTVETKGLKKKNRGFMCEDVLMSRKWGGKEGDIEHGKNVANYCCDNKSAIIYELVFVEGTIFSS